MLRIRSLRSKSTYQRTEARKQKTEWFDASHSESELFCLLSSDFCPLIAVFFKFKTKKKKKENENFKKLVRFIP